MEVVGWHARLIAGEFWCCPGLCRRGHLVERCAAAAVAVECPVELVGARRAVKEPKVDPAGRGQFDDAVEDARMEPLGIDDDEVGRVVAREPRRCQADVLALVASLSRDVAVLSERLEDVAGEDVYSAEVWSDSDPDRVAVVAPVRCGELESGDVDVVYGHLRNAFGS
jgi:hypothetical protein